MISSHKIHLRIFFPLLLGCNLLQGMETKTHHATIQESQQDVPKKLIVLSGKKRVQMLTLPLYKQEATLNAICEDYQKQLLASEKDAHATALDRLKKVPNNQGLCDIAKDWRAWFEWQRSRIECTPYKCKEDQSEDKLGEYTAKDMINLERYLKSVLQPAFSAEFQQEFTKIVHDLYKKHDGIRWMLIVVKGSTATWKSDHCQKTLQQEQVNYMAHFSDQEKLRIAAIAEDENDYEITDWDEHLEAQFAVPAPKLDSNDEYTLIDADKIKP